MASMKFSYELMATLAAEFNLYFFKFQQYLLDILLFHKILRPELLKIAEEEMSLRG